MNRILQFLSIAMLSACMGIVSSMQSGNTIFRPFNGSFGYSHIQLGEAYFEVGFSAGNTYAPTMLKELALIRAAELARERGFDYIEVISTNQELVELGSTQESSRSFTPADSAKKGKEETVTNVRQNSRYDIVMTVKFFSQSNNTSLLYVDTILADAKKNPNYRVEEKKQK